MDELNAAIQLLTSYFSVKLIALSVAQGLFIGFFTVGTKIIFDFAIAPGGSYFHATRTASRLIKSSEQLERTAARSDGLIAVAKLQLDGLTPTRAATSTPAIAPGLPAATALPSPPAGPIPILAPKPLGPPQL